MTTVANGENFVKVVSFDTMTNKDLPNYSFTLRGKSPGFKRTRRSRTFMVATDLANYSEYALTWATDEIMDEGDELIVLRVVTVDMNDKKGNMANLLDFEAKQSREKASQVMAKIMKNTAEEKKISVVIEFVIGKVQETIQNMITMYQPSLLIVGTRGLSEFKGMLLGSVSKYCLQHSPVPVAVVRPEDKKVKKSSKQRLSGLMRLGSGNIPTMSSFSNVSEDSDGPKDSSMFNKLSLKQSKYRSRSTSPAPR
ncbi:uncharacterized protein EV154DRAFT_503821 [Mucor mucedo]|uniref:UspA domain-containing protein n=1 Tax=Mucor saturninus TaxID=64648 RepID=A0A8H7QIV9_9FUNG|nr:uncharacterized protein EV154DRAFT_503821 [Mucor mucedo]KAG2192525.1 hypothetical protein INT47_006001 [Mucor saturninus]KAI7892694.1 hypothetical protein EV154DRAFT_503821 [Mucor mucedo]